MIRRRLTLTQAVDRAQDRVRARVARAQAWESPGPSWLAFAFNGIDRNIEPETTDLDVDLETIVNGAIARALDDKVALDPSLVSAIARALDDARTLDRAFYSAHYRDDVLGPRLEHIIDRALVVDRDHLTSGDYDLHRGIHDALNRARTRTTASSRARVSRSASWTIEVAVRLLPAHERSRWGEEFASELYDLASTSRRGQLSHAFRILGRVRALRHNLAAAKRNMAGVK